MQKWYILLQTLRRFLNDNNFSNVDIVAADGGWEIADDIPKDTELASAISYIG